MSDFKRIDPASARELRQSGAVLVDIRRPEDFAGGHVRGARHLDNHSLADFIAAADFDAPLLVLCYHGHSSQNAAAHLAHQGFAEVYSVDGGFELWRTHYPDEVARAGED